MSLGGVIAVCRIGVVQLLHYHYGQLKSMNESRFREQMISGISSTETTYCERKLFNWMRHIPNNFLSHVGGSNNYNTSTLTSNYDSSDVNEMTFMIITFNYSCCINIFPSCTEDSLTCLLIFQCENAQDTSEVSISGRKITSTADSGAFESFSPVWLLIEVDYITCLYTALGWVRSSLRQGVKEIELWRTRYVS